MNFTRRHFLRRAAAVTAGFAGLSGGCSTLGVRAHHPGELVHDPLGRLDLPPGFSYQVFSSAGQRMDDGLLVPPMHDGMGAFPGPNGRTILVRNHELSGAGGGQDLPGGPMDGVPRSKIYDRLPMLGGTTTLVYDTKRRRLERHYLSLTGTCRNCAGGSTPWGSWITCEETELQAGEGRQRDHGYNFEVPAMAVGGLVDPIPLISMGRFQHEAVAVDPETGIVYQTEDQSDGLIYRYIPDVPGRLVHGGRLEALVVADQPGLDTRNWIGQDGGPLGPLIETGKPMQARWMPLEEVDAPLNDLRHRGFAGGAARFARGEGMWFGRDAVYFACTNGGKKQLGQIWRYVPSRTGDAGGVLELFFESDDRAVLENADNLTFSPWGTLFMCEDSPEDDRLIEVSSEGEASIFAINRFGHGELAGGVFSPDGTTLFVNAQSQAVTIAITGPWARRR